eukprot:3139743-Prymnesium_polylepis.1
MKQGRGVVSACATGDVGGCARARMRGDGAACEKARGARLLPTAASAATASEAPARRTTASSRGSEEGQPRREAGGSGWHAATGGAIPAAPASRSSASGLGTHPTAAARAAHISSVFA